MDNTNAVAQSNFSLLYHLLNTKHANADHRAHLDRISNDLTEYNISLVSMGILHDSVHGGMYYIYTCLHTLLLHPQTNTLIRLDHSLRGFLLRSSSSWFCA